MSEEEDNRSVLLTSDSEVEAFHAKNSSRNSADPQPTTHSANAAPSQANNDGGEEKQPAAKKQRKDQGKEVDVDAAGPKNASDEKKTKQSAGAAAKVDRKEGKAAAGSQAKAKAKAKSKVPALKRPKGMDKKRFAAFGRFIIQTRASIYICLVVSSSA